MPIRLQKFLAETGVASRRQCEELIRAGRVRVNGEVVCDGTMTFALGPASSGATRAVGEINVSRE